MSLWTLLDGGNSLPQKPKSFRGKLLFHIGHCFASRHRTVVYPRSCLIHPGAKIHPRNGAIHLGENCTVGHGAMIQGNVAIGDDCSLQAYSILTGYGTIESPTGLISIGNGVRIASHCMMIAANHVFDDPNAPIHNQGLQHAPITIEDNVWIGGRVNVTAGVTIGHGSIIGAGSVVTRSIPAMSIAVGAPARVIRQR